MTDVAPQPSPNGYVHPALEALEQYEATVSDCPLPMRRADFIDQCKRDVGAATDEPVAEVYVQEKHDIVQLRLDGKTAAVVLYAARLMMMNYEDVAREARVSADRFPRGSYSSENRIEIAARKEKVIHRIRVLYTAYRQAIDKEYWGV